MVDKDILDACQENKIVVQSYGPIGSAARKPANGVEGSMNCNLLDDPILKPISVKKDCTVAQLCMAYALRKGVGVVTKTENENRMQENLNSAKTAGILNKEDMEEIGQLNKNMRKFWDPYLVA